MDVNIYVTLPWSSENDWRMKKMSEKIIEQYGRVTIYTEPNHPSPIYHVDGSIDPNPYGDLAVLL